MRDLQDVDGEDGHGGIDTEALQPRQESVGSHEEGYHVGEGGHTHRHPGVLHRLTEQVRETGGLT